jgi:sugar phosphate permease
MHDDDVPAPDAEAAVVRKAFARLIPFLVLLYVVAYLDRVNLGFAKLHLKDLPWFTDSVFTTGAGLFFVGYFFFEVPSNLILEKVGARRWIARIMITWGIVSMIMALMKGVASFYFLRVLLGVAEAGFFPGVLLYLTYWFTQKERARAVALFMTANAIALSLGNPLSGWILDSTKGMGGLAGWQWLFILEGIPAVLLAGVVLWYLPDGPKKATWLTEEEKALLQLRLDRERAALPVGASHPDMGALAQAARQPGVWLLCGVFFLLVGGMYGITMWLPTLVKQIAGGDDTRTGLLTAIPYVFAGVIMVLNGIHSDKTRERRLHIAIPAAIGALGMALSAAPGMPIWGAMVCLSVAASGMWSILGPFWSIPPLYLRGAGVAAGLALINSVGNLAGFAGPKLIDQIKGSSDNFLPSLLGLSSCVLLGGLLALAIPKSIFTKDSHR